MPGQISMDGFSRFILRIFTVAAAVLATPKLDKGGSAAELKLVARMFALGTVAHHN